MLGAVSQLLDLPVEDLRLTQSMVGGKYGVKVRKRPGFAPFYTTNDRLPGQARDKHRKS